MSTPERFGRKADDDADDYLNPGLVLRHSPFRNAPKVRTGLPALDNGTEGGIPFGATVGISGPPGSGKTTLAIQLARQAREQYGAAVTAAFYDEGTEGAALKLGQQFGIDYELLRSVDEKSVVSLEEYCLMSETVGAFQFVPLTQELLQMLANARRDKLQAHPLVLVTDTLQKARFELSEDGPNGGERFRIDREVTLLRDAALTLPALNIMTSEVSRGAYASKDLSRRTTALAASAESRSIEYGCELLLVLSNRADGLVDVEVAKNRLGRGRGSNRFVLRHDRERATYSEVALDAAQEGDEERKREQTVSAWSADEHRVIQCVRENPGRSAKMLRELLRMNMQRVAALLEELLRKGTLERTKAGWFEASTSSGPQEDS